MQRDISDLADRGEPVALMEPILIGEASILRPILTDLAHPARVACKRYRGRQPIEMVIWCLMTICRDFWDGGKRSSPGRGND